MTKPGTQTGQEGNCVPLSGGFEIRGQSSGDYDVLTITAPSTMDANYLVCRSNIAEGSTRHDNDVFAISSNGGMKFRGYTMSSGNSTAAGVTALGASCFGHLYYIGAFSTASKTSSGWFLHIPQPAAGAEVGFVFQSTFTSTQLTTIGTSAADKVFVHGAAHDALAMAGASMAAEIEGVLVRFISDGTYWYPMINNELSDTAATPTVSS